MSTTIHNNTPVPSDTRKVDPRLMLILLLLVFLGPFGFALTMHKKDSIATLRHNNVGDLIVPVKQASDLSFTSIESHTTFNGDQLAGKWQFIYVPPLTCQETCHETIDLMGQIHHSLNKFAPRLERMLVLLAHNKINEFTQYDKKYLLDMRSYEKTLSTIGDKTKRDAVGEFYLIDPKGHIMMYYTGDTPAKGILKDLNKLMKASTIG